MKKLFTFLLASFSLVATGFLITKNPLADTNDTGLLLPQTLESSPDALAESIYLTRNANQDPVAVWTEKISESDQFQILYAVWDGRAFGPPTAIPISENPKVHAESIPKLIFKPNGDMLLFYEIKIPHPTNERVSHIHYQASKDGGRSWTSPASVHADTTRDKGHSFFDVALLPDGEIGAVWLDTALIKGGRSVLFSKTNSSNRFGQETVVDSLACQCCRTALTSDENGQISVVYRDILPGSIRDISVASSTDGGLSFSQPISFSFDMWNLDGCPHNGPDVVSHEGRIFATWFTGASQQGVYFAELDARGKTIRKEKISSKGRNIQLTLLNGQPLLVYSETTGSGEQAYTRIKSLDPRTGKMIDLSPTGANASLPTVMPVPEGGFVASWLQARDQNSQEVKALYIPK